MTIICQVIIKLNPTKHVQERRITVVPNPAALHVRHITKKKKIDEIKRQSRCSWGGRKDCTRQSDETGGRGGKGGDVLRGLSFVPERARVGYKCL